MKLEFSQKIFLEKLKYQTSWKSVQWEPSCSMQTDGRMDGHHEDDSHFLLLCKHA
jgi:hypothetical protein